MAHFPPRCHANIPDWHSIREIWTEARWSFISTVPPCLLDWSAPICEAVWVAYCKMMGSLSDKGEWGVNCYSAERNHQTSSCCSWRVVSRALQKPSDRAARGCSPPASGKHTGAEAAPLLLHQLELYQLGQKRSSIIWQIYAEAFKTLQL